MPILSALDWLKRSRLPDGKMARFYELRTNKPLYMTADYQLTYSDADAPSHYGWTGPSNIELLERRFRTAQEGKVPRKPSTPPAEDRVRQILRDLDLEGRWVSTAGDGKRLVGQPKFARGFKFLASEVFNANMATLSDYVTANTGK